MYQWLKHMHDVKLNYADLLFTLQVDLTEHIKGPKGEKVTTDLGQ